MDVMPWLLAWMLWMNSLFAAGWSYDPVQNALVPPTAPSKGAVVSQTRPGR